MQGVDNWCLWKFQIQIYLKSSDVWDIVIGKNKLAEPPAADANQTLKDQYEKEKTKWTKADGIAQKIIVTTITEQCMMHIINFTTSKDMWDKLTGIYEQKSQSVVHILQQEWYSLTKDPSHDMASHISKIEDLAHRLKSLGEDMKDADVMTKILLTLPANYDYFISSWESVIKEDQTKTNLTSRLLIEEMRHNRREKDANALASASFNKNKEGAPKEHHKSKNKVKKPGKCHTCGKPGHWSRECWHNQDKDDDQNTQKKYSGNKPKGYGNSKQVKGEGLIGEALTTVQKSQNAAVDTWFMDSGASDHMTHRRDRFVDYYPLNEVMHIKIGDGEFLKGVGRGNINILAYDSEDWTEKHF